jgi:hypothetical protein
VIDRASTFADPEIVQLLKTRFVPVAINQACQRRQQDTEGDFYRKIVLQRPEMALRFDGSQTTQGFYIASAAGDLLLYNNNRNPERLRRLMKQKLGDFRSRSGASADVAELSARKVDRQYNLRPPEGGLVVRVQAKVLDGYASTENRWRQIFQSALSRDNLWISASEHQAMLRGEIPPSLQQRIARFHLVDNTRGEPPMWRADEIHSCELEFVDGQLDGTVHLETKDHSRGYRADLKGAIEIKEGAVVRFDMIAVGEFWGQGRYTGGAPEGKFPLAISFTLSDGTDVADRIPPQASRGWLRGYLR